MSAVAAEQVSEGVPVFAPRLLAGARPGATVPLDRHLAQHGSLGSKRALAAELAASGLTGRGGAGFPVASKLRAVASRRGRPIVVVNGAEGEPLSRKDRVLLSTVPNLVIDGAVALARELGTADVAIVLSPRTRPARAPLEAAIAERAARRLDGFVEVSVFELPAGLVTGQETSVVQFLNGRPARPTTVPPRPSDSGVAGRPTLIQNAETMAHVALIGRRGAGWFRSVGTADDPGSALFTVSGAVSQPGVHELPLGTSLAELVSAAGGITGRPRAVLVGGYAGTWLDGRAASRLTLAETSLRAEGGTLGVGAVSVLPETACGLCETARVAKYLAGESAGQCGPCVRGLDAVAGSLERLVSGRGGDLGRLGRWLGEIPGRGACKHPDGAIRLIASALRVFADDVEGHRHGRCSRSGVRILPVPREGDR
jgi:NADH:ubiquinone oxidoreductase subunit F (NADH-binding)